MASATHGSVSPSTSLGPFERRLVSLLEQLKPQLRTLATASGAVRYSVDDALEQLCAKHRDLARQKRNTLRKAVERALNVFVQRQQQQPGKRVRGSDEDEQLHRSKRKNSNDGGDDDKDGDDGIDSGDGSGGDGEDEDEEEGDGSESGKEDEDSVLYYKKGSSEPIRMMQVNDPNLLNQALTKSYKQKSADQAPAVGLNPYQQPPPPSQPQQEQQQSDALSNATVQEIINTPDAKRRLRGAPKNASPAMAAKLAKLAQLRAETGKKDKEPGSSGGSSTSATAGKLAQATRPTLRYSDIGGFESCLQDVRELIERPLTHPEIYVHLGVEPPRGVLLHGPPGCGKTRLAHAIAGELDVPFFKVSAPEIVSGMSGESEQRIRELFADARDMAPCIIFIDEIDAVTPKRDTAQREMERRIVAQLLTCFDELSMEYTDNKPVCVIAATNRPDALDPALRRAGRFDREIAIGSPDENARAHILGVLTKKLRVSGDFDFKALAKATPGFVGADLQALTQEAANFAVKRIFQDIQGNGDGTAMEILTTTSAGVAGSSSSSAAAATSSAIGSPAVSEHDARVASSNLLRSMTDPLTAEQLEPLCVTMEDFEKAIPLVQPSAKREGFATIPDVTWQDVGALTQVRDELQMAVVEPIKSPEKFERMGLSTPAGVLLYGPPGCGKTMLAKAIANESRCNFISVKGPELLNKFVGESERGVRQVFERARTSSPCVIFFDELDALAPRRGADSASQASERVVNTLLTEMDGLNARRQVYCIAATNRPDMIDEAMLRPGRLDKLLYVALPTPDERVQILWTLVKKTPLSEDAKEKLPSIALSEKCTNYSGADLAALVREAAISAIRVDATEVTFAHFELALTKVQPSVSKKSLKTYDALAATLRQ